MLAIKRGTTPTLSFSINVPIESLGEPRCVLRQEDYIAYLKTEIDGDNNTLLCTIDEEDSQLLVGGFSAWLEISWVDSLGNTVVFPTEEVYIEDAYIPFPEFDLIEDSIDDEIETDEFEDIDEDTELVDTEEDLMNDDLETMEDHVNEEYDEIEPDEEEGGYYEDEEDEEDEGE